MITSRSRIALAFVMTFVAFVFGVLLFTKPAHAANPAAFNAGRIIDDPVFNNVNSMSVNDIQNFLNSKVPNCQAGYTCLKDYTEGGKTSAQIIYDWGRFFDINPQVILVTLQKENGLVTDTFPYSWQYRTAMGFACPDNGSCNPEYYGFTNQVFQGARHLRHFQQQNPSWYMPHRIGLNNIKWHPNAACGTSQVNIENGATSALYSYTPYRPNQVALNNLYGTGDGCSAYGNRNFWRDFTDWFGSTSATNYDYQFVNASATTTIPMEPEQPRNGHFITLRNTGAKTWYADGSVPTGERPVRLILRNYQESPFADINDPNWLATRSQIRMATPTVAPGETGIFIFNFKGPYQYYSGFANNFVPVVDGLTVMKDINMRFVTTSQLPSYSMVSAINPAPNIFSNDTTTASIIIKNTSTLAWYADGAVPPGKNPTRIATRSNVPSSFADRSNQNWMGSNTKIKMSPNVVNPGENATFSFSFHGPFSTKSEVFKFVPEIADYAQFADIGMQFSLSTQNYSSNYQFISATNPPSAMPPGAIANIQLILKNNGSVMWRNEDNRIWFGSTRLVLQDYLPSKFYNPTDANWLSNSQIKMTTPTVAPGQNGVFNFQWKAPTTPGTYTEKVRPVFDGYQWLPDIGMQFTVSVQ